MRLINTDTHLFEEVLGRNIPDYAILSHTWEAEEVSYAYYAESKRPRKKGFAKIYKTCELAAKEHIPYAWVDTCCIDKRSSAELTEAINSMFRWYQRAKVCYAFLSDLPTVENSEYV
ncbi:hypothetical protein HBI23_129850 [Parastagonospora nodorum]|nr:hypothetical protein HBI12_071180 [Parastagonospora nodorum]KAH5442439.1 hypothetical protein HBI47_029360 [Parastagonospora nodorum]KAH5660102.1 hypothetical protein HBI23_129850 [Parastagonospora nodorum]